MRNTIKLALLADVFAGAQATAAPLQNGDFATESLAPGWTANGTTSVENLLAGAAPSGKLFQAFIGNAGVVSLYALGSGLVLTEVGLSAALGLATGELASLKHPATLATSRSGRQSSRALRRTQATRCRSIGIS